MYCGWRTRGGAVCAIALKKEARKTGKTVNVVIMGHKKFTESRHYNQCIGALSPPLESILKKELELPAELKCKEMQGYCFHPDKVNLDL